jgi:hypothetical protein
VAAHEPEAVDKLLNICYAIERMDDKCEARPIPILMGRRFSLPLVRLDAFNHLLVDCCHDALPTGLARQDCGLRCVFVCGKVGEFSNTVRARLDPLCTR